jgi:hypothetical protein
MPAARRASRDIRRVTDALRKYPLTFPKLILTIECKFYHDSVTRAAGDRILSAEIAGLVARHAAASRLTGPERAAALTELAEVAAGRSDLLARCAGLAVGIHEGDLDEDRYLRAAQLCIEAGADTSLVPHWIDIGRQRARNIAARRRAD